MIGEWFALTSAMLWGTIPVLVRKGFSHASPSVAVIVGLFASLPLLLGVFLFHPRSVLEVVPSSAALWFAAVGITGPCLGRLFNYIGVERLGAARATPLINSTPLFTTVFALIFLREHITLKILLGVLSIVGGILVLTGQQRQMVALPSVRPESFDKVRDRLRDNEVEG
jgi:drug/metabolite transporter (DMT)-like permease